MFRWSYCSSTLFAATLITACGGSDGEENSGSNDVEEVSCYGLSPAKTIAVGDGAPSFSRDAVTIESGETVKWNWAAGEHTVTGDASANFSEDAANACGTDDTGEFDSGTLSKGDSFCLKFNQTGTFWYQCTVGDHCENGMYAKISVE